MSQFSCTTVNSDFTVDTDSQCYFADVSAGSITATLPSLSSNYNGTFWFFKIVANNGSDTNTLTISPPTGGSIDLLSSIVLSGRDGIEIMVYTDSSNNFLIKSRGS